MERLKLPSHVVSSILLLTQPRTDKQKNMIYKALALLALLSVAYGYPALEKTEDDNLIEKTNRTDLDVNPKKQDIKIKGITDEEAEKFISNLMMLIFLNEIQNEPETADLAEEKEESDELSDAEVELVVEEFLKLINATEDMPEEQLRAIEEIFLKLEETLMNLKPDELFLDAREIKDAVNNKPEDKDDENLITTTSKLETTELVPEIVP